MIAWTDVETTGLDERTGDLLEVAIVITDDQLVEKASFSTIIVPPDIDVTIKKMDPYVLNMHTKNGLIDEIRDYSRKPSTGDLKETSAYLFEKIRDAFAYEPVVLVDRCTVCKLPIAKHKWNKYLSDVTTAAICATGSTYAPHFDPPMAMTPFAGNTVSFDRRWLRQHLPDVEKIFSYRSIDVSTITEWAKRLQPDVYNARPRSTDTHRALVDARGSIAAMKYYLDRGFIGGVRAVDVK